MNHLKLFEDFGSGKETFEDKIEMYGMLRNFSVYGSKGTKYEELDGAKGNIKFSCEMDVKNSGIEDMHFYLESFSVDFEIISGDDETTTDTVEVKDVDSEKVKVEVGKLPYYLTEFEIDMKGSNDPSKWVYTLAIGSN